MSPTQQPAQVAGEHAAAGWQTPALHDSFALQAAHTAPPLPHAAGVPESTHWFPTQQPGQVAALQVTGVWHVRSFGWPTAAQV